LKCESMPTQRLEEKRVEERAGEGERERERGREGERERERKSTHMRERKRALEKALWLLLLYVFFLNLGLPYENWA